MKDKLASLSRHEQDEVIAYLFHLRRMADPQYEDRIQRRLNDKDPNHWLSPDEFESELNKKETR